MIWVSRTPNSLHNDGKPASSACPVLFLSSAYPRACSAVAELILGLRVAKGQLFIVEEGMGQSVHMWMWALEHAGKEVGREGGRE